MMREEIFAPVPTRMNGRLFPSQAEAARALGVSPHTVHAAVRDGRDTVRPGGKGWNRKPIEFEGVTYPSHRALAKHLGCDAKALNRAICDGRLEAFVANVRKRRRR